MDLQPVLEDDLLLLRPLREHDLNPLYEVAKDPLIWEQHPNSDRYKKTVFATFFQDSLKSKGALVIIDKATAEIIGSTRFKLISGVDYAIEIGWTFLARNYWGGRVNRAMKQLMIDHAFQSMEEVIFYIHEQNVRSQKAVEKIGGIRITDTAYGYILKNNWDDWTYRIRKSDWIKA